MSEKNTEGGGGRQSWWKISARLGAVIVVSCFVVTLGIMIRFTVARHHGLTLCIAPSLNFVFINPRLNEMEKALASVHEAAHVVETVSGTTGCYSRRPTWLRWTPGYDADASFRAEIGPHCAEAVAMAAQFHDASSSAISDKWGELWQTYGHAGVDSTQFAREFESSCERRLAVFAEGVSSAAQKSSP